MSLSHQQMPAATEQVESSPQQVPAPDDQALYGNAFVACGLFGGDKKKESDWKPWLDEVRDATGRFDAEQDLQQQLEVDNYEDGQATVTQEEFDEMVGLYHDIREGKANIQLDDSAYKTPEDKAAFRAATMEDIGRIMQTPSGRAMLKDLARNPDGRKVTLGAAADPDHPETMPLHQGRTHDELDPEERWAQHRDLERGKPADTRIEYMPGHTVQTPHDGEIQSDVVLYHELVHAYHFGKGDIVKGSGYGAVPVDNSEIQTTQGWHGDEPYTENLYRQERNFELGEDLPRRETYGGRDVDEGPWDRAIPSW